MAVGILIDAFLVRTLLVPCLLTLLGARARWPARPPADVASGPGHPAATLATPAGSSRRPSTRSE